MKLTHKQQKEIEVWEYYIPTCSDWEPKTDRDVEMFFESSERGLHKNIPLASIEISFVGGKQIIKKNDHYNSYFNALRWGKKWAYRAAQEMIPEGLLDGTMPWISVLGLEEGDTPIPESVMKFLAKTVWKGFYKEHVEYLYYNSGEKQRRN